MEQHKKFSFFISEAFSIGNGVAGISGSLKFPNYHMEENTRVETPTFPSVSDFKDPVFYMGISGYEINNQISIADKPVFFHNNGKDSIKYWDLVPARGQYEHVEDSLVTRKKASPFYYYESQKAILFPASKAGYITFKILFYLSMFSYGVAFFCVLFCVIRLCLAIADGQFFTPKNLDRLYIIAAAVFTPFFINWLVSTIMTWIYLPKAGGDVFLINKEGPNILSLAPGYLLFLFAGAFKRGLELQEEHDLTV
ncbi:DUF2975 domain-containing protein [Filimonas lacunae]|uniref:DUF2975 domain-containing protein n=1 Tax=Filimonas lacunae TaxID=477680 RepID=UPI0013565212|nr:DUF2975 domain-containing protein [Filimonas lacunae]